MMKSVQKLFFLCLAGALSSASAEQRDYAADAAFMRRYADAAVRIAKKKVDAESQSRAKLACKLPIKPRLSSGLNNIFVWDAAFCCLWAKDAPKGELPILETLDNLYLLQQDDGFICREHTPDGRPVWSSEHPTAYNPPVISWAELELFRAGVSTSDRLRTVYPKLTRFHDCYRRNLRRPDGLYAGDILGGGMDDVPRWPVGMTREQMAVGGKVFERRHLGEGLQDTWYWTGLMKPIIPEHSWNFQAGWIDMSAQMAFDCLNLAAIADALGRPDEAAAYRREHEELARTINEKCWDEKAGFYFDCGPDGLIRRYTVASFWVLIARVAPEDRARRMVAALTDPELFGRPVPVPSLAKADPSYAPETGYWTGAVWPPTTYMTLRGLRLYGYEELAQQLARKWYNANARLFELTGTIWENVSPEQCDRPKRMSGREFCGWSALAPVTLPVEFGWLPAAAPLADFNAKDYGLSAEATPKANAAAIQKAIDEAAAAGGGRVVVPAGEWVTGTIWLKSHVELHLEKDCLVRMSPNQADLNRSDAYPENVYLFRSPKDPGEGWNGAHLIIIYRCEGASITGPGALSGNSEAYLSNRIRWDILGCWPMWNLGVRADDLYWSVGRPGHVIAISYSKDVLLDKLTVRDANTWTTFVDACDGVTVRDYTVRNNIYTGTSDGIDIECSRNVLVERADIVTGDDGLTVRASNLMKLPGKDCTSDNVTFRDCTVWSQACGMRLGVGGGLIRNVTVENVTIRHAGSGFCFIASYGAGIGGAGVDFENIRFRNCTVEDVYYNWDAHNSGVEQKFGMRNIVFENCLFRGRVQNGVVVNRNPHLGKPDIREENCRYDLLPTSSFLVPAAEGAWGDKRIRLDHRPLGDGRGPCGRIVLAKDPSPAVREAAKLLKTCLDRTTGYSFALADDTDHAGAWDICVGVSARTAKKAGDFTAESPYYVGILPRQIELVGLDEAGADGTLAAVRTFVTRYLGVKLEKDKEPVYPKPDRNRMVPILEHRHPKPDPQVVPGAPFAHNMVLQRGRKVPVWGRAAAKATVSVSFAGQVRETQADAAGAWRVELGPLEASAEGRKLVIGSTVITNVLVGEVWLASGQSNMELPVWHEHPLKRDLESGPLLALADDPALRFVNVSNYERADAPTNDIEAVWHAANAEGLKAAKFSSVAYYYARILREKLKVPVGVVGVWWGGTQIQPWIPGGKIWNRQVAPLAPFAVRGLIWYQGENNVGQADRYVGWMHELYDGWSKAFENQDLSLYFVQIAPCQWYKPEKMLELQMAQQRFADEEPHAAMAVIADVGDLTHIHPLRKETVGLRLALHALRRDYGFSLEDESPHLASCAREGDVVALTFDHLKEAHVYYRSGMWQETGPREPDFEVAGEDGVWHPADVVNRRLESEARGVKYYEGRFADGNVLKVRSAAVKEPKKVRYLHSKPWQSVFFNEMSLPCGPFAADVP